MTQRFRVFTGMIAAMGLLTAGCLPASISAAASGAAKIAAGQACTLTGSEIVALIDVGNQFGADINVDISGTQADAVAQFLATNEVCAFNDFENVLDQAIDDPTSLELPEGIVALFLAEFEEEPTERTSNQGGGSLVSGVTKVVNGQVSGLSADEIQIIGDNLNNLNANGGQNVTLSDEQALAISAYLVANQINTIGEFLEAAESGDATIPEGAEELFEGF